MPPLDPINVRRFAGINVLLHPATDVNLEDPASFSSLINADLFQEGAIHVRGGLGRPDSWAAFFAAGGNLTTGLPSTAAFGTPILSLHAIDFRRRTAPAPLHPENGISGTPSGSRSNIATGLSTVQEWCSVLGDGSLVYLCNGTDKPQVWDGMSAATRNWGISAIPTPALTATAAAGGALSAGDYYYFYAWLNSASGTYGTVSAISAKMTATAGQKGSLSNAQAAPSPSDSQITHWRLFRNAAGDATTFYKVADIAVGTTTYSDVSSDIDIQANDVMFADNSPPDGKYPFCAFFNGRMLLYGSRVESTGTASATNGSATVTGTSTEWKASHVGQYIVFGNDAARYTISAVASATSLTLSTTYAGSTAAGKSFSIYPVRGSDVAWSRATNYEAFPFGNSIGIGSADGDLPTGFFFNGNTPYLAKEQHVYRFTYSTNPSPVDGEGAVFNILSDRGMINQHCCVTVGAESYVMDKLGVYLFTGGQPQEVDMAIRRFIQPSSESVQINFNAGSTFHGIWEPKSDSIVFFVCLGTDTKPKNALVYDRTRQRWTSWSFPQAITCSMLLKDAKGRLRAWVGDENGYIWALNINVGIDGAYGASGCIEGFASSFTATTLVHGDFDPDFDTTGFGLQGIAVNVYSGTGAGQTRIIQSNTATTLTVAAWSVTPAAGDAFRVGAVEFSGKTQWFSFGLAAWKKNFTSIVFFFEPNNTPAALGGEPTWVGVTLYYDYQNPNSPFTDWKQQEETDGLQIPSTAATDGEVQVYLDQADGRVVVPVSVKSGRLVQIALRWPQVAQATALLGFSLMADKPQSNNVRDS